MTDTFVHLHLHTEYSLADGLVRIQPLMRAVAEAGMPAVALTDRDNLFACIKFYRAAEAAGVKPIIGVDLRVRGAGPDDPPGRIVLLCKDRDGFRSLTRLVTRAYLEGQADGAPMAERAWVAEAARGLIALSAAREGDVGQALLAGNTARAEALLGGWREVFGDDFFLEVQRTGRSGDEAHLHAAVDLATRTGTPVVASNDVRFLAEEDFEAHEVRVCIHEGYTLTDERRPRPYSPQQYLRSPAEMAERFADLPEALDNAVEIARRCNLRLSFGKNVLPDFPIPEGTSTEAYFRAQARAGLERRLEALPESPAADRDARRRAYEERLERELDVICQMGFPGYFLIVADFIQWAKDHGIPVGPGRGSGAGSLVAYALRITDLDPLAYDLLFERFLNPERVSMPDFDVDFCMERRDEVIEYVARRYGRERVSQIITYGSMAAKAVVRDVGRVLGHGYGFVDKIAKLIPFEVGMTLDKALDQEPELRRLAEEDEEVGAILAMARKLEGLARNAGKHAGGVVIAPSELTDYTPLYCEPGGQGVVTQLDKDDVEAAGLVKFDFLGLRTLTIIDWAVRMIDEARARAGEPPLDVGGLPLDDPQTFRLLQEQRTTAVFQLESRGMKDLIKRLQPDTFEDIVALVALYRPGPLQSGMVDDFILRKHGKAKVEYPHPALEPILKSTYGVILYQEQVMQIAQVLAGYTLGGADLLRRAMGKKKPEEMAKQREIFVSGAVERGVAPGTAAHIFDLMEKFAGYGFNKSHSAAYALLSYQTAWLKAHYPAQFMAAVLSADMDNTDKVVTLIDECRCMGLAIAPPDINRSRHAFTVTEDGTIVYGLGAIKGVGEAAVQGLIAEREANGPFRSLEDLCVRCDLQKLNRRVLEALIRAGALDGLGPNRASLMAHLGRAMAAAEQHVRSRQTGQVDLFGGPVAAATAAVTPEIPDWDEAVRLTGEKETLGLYLTGHPYDAYREELSGIARRSLGAWQSVDAPARDESAVVAGLVTAVRTRNMQSGRAAFMTLDDGTGRMEVAVFGEAFERYQGLLVKDRIVVVEGRVALDEFSGQLRLRAREVLEVDEARVRFAERLEIRLRADRPLPELAGRLEEALQPFRGEGARVRIHYANAKARAALDLSDGFRVAPREALIRRLEALEAVQAVVPVYGPAMRPAPKAAPGLH